MSKRLLLFIALLCLTGSYVLPAVQLKPGDIVQFKLFETGKYYKVHKFRGLGLMKADGEKNDPQTRFMVFRGKKGSYGFYALNYSGGRFMSASAKGKGKHFVQFKSRGFGKKERFKIVGESSKMCFLVSEKTGLLVVTHESGGFKGFATTLELKKKSRPTLSIEVVGRAVHNRSMKAKYNEMKRNWDKARKGDERAWKNFRKLEERRWKAYRKVLKDHWKRERKQTDRVYHKQIRDWFKFVLLKPMMADPLQYEHVMKWHNKNFTRGGFGTIRGKRAKFMETLKFMTKKEMCGKVETPEKGLQKASQEPSPVVKKEPVKKEPTVKMPVKETSPKEALAKKAPVAKEKVEKEEAEEYEDWSYESVVGEQAFAGEGSE